MIKQLYYEHFLVGYFTKLTIAFKGEIVCWVPQVLAISGKSSWRRIYHSSAPITAE